MNKIETAIKYISDNFDKLSPDVKGGIQAVWVAKRDTAGAYEVNEEWVGVRLDGSFAYAYASGCSCWDGDYDAEVLNTMKEVKAFPFKLDKSHKDFTDAIVRFAEAHKKNNKVGSEEL